MVVVCWGSGTKSGRALRARSTNSSTASSLIDNDGTRQVTSPGMPIGSRLVANTETPRPDAQSDRSQIRLLQGQGAGHRVAGFGERHHEAVALALLQWPNPAVAGYQLGDHRVETRDRRRHLVRPYADTGWFSHSRVEPSTSASSSVTVPVGNSLTAGSPQFSGTISA